MSLRLDLRTLGAREARIERTVGVDAFVAGDDDDYAVAAPVGLRLRVLRDGETYRLVGHLGTALRVACGRCLDVFELPVENAIDLRYVPQRDNVGEGEIEVAEDDLTTAFYRDGHIDLELMLREQFQLSLPMKPLCRPSCRGICPGCGTNRNTGRCACDTAWRDPRFAALDGLLTDRRKG